MRALIVLVTLGFSTLARGGTPTVTFTGNAEIPAFALRAAMSTPLTSTTDPFDEEALERDLLLISAYYWDHGFANVRVGEPKIDTVMNSIAIPIEEGVTFTIADVAITGTLIGSARTNLGRIHVKKGELFSRTRIADDRLALSTYYEDLGYASANVLPLTHVDLAKRTIALTFEIAPGPVTTIEKINVYDTDALLEASVRHALGITTGTRFSTTDLVDGKRRIEHLAHVESVVVSTKHGSADDRIEINIEITDDNH